MKARRLWLITAAVAIASLVAFFLLFRKQSYLATSPDGQVRYVNVKYESGTSFSTAFSNRSEAWVRDLLFDIGFRKVQRTSLKMTSPPDSHLFILEYAGDIGGVKRSSIQAELLHTDGRKYELITVSGNTYGFQKRQFACWVLNGVTNLDRQGFKLKVYLPKHDPAILPLPTD